MKFAGYLIEAQVELDDALARSSDPIRFQDRIDAAIQDIVSGIITYPKFNGTVARVCPLGPLPYSLIYVDRGHSIRIYAVAHHKRRPGYWKSRLKQS